MGRGEILEHQRALPQMTARQMGFDGGLTLHQPIHGCAEIVFLQVIEAERLAQRAVAGFGAERAVGGEFGARFEDAGSDEGERGTPVAAVGGVEQAGQSESVEGGQHGGTMAVRPGAGNGGGLALQSRAQHGNFGRRPVREAGDGAIADVAVFAKALAEEDGGSYNNEPKSC